MAKTKRTIDDKLEFINKAKEMQISKINVVPSKNARIKTKTIVFKKYYEYSVH